MLGWPSLPPALAEDVSGALAMQSVLQQHKAAAQGHAEGWTPSRAEPLTAA